MAVVRVMRMFTPKRRADARRKREISKPSMPKAFTTRKPEMVSCRISEMSRQRRSDVSLLARRRRPSRTRGRKARGMPTREIEGQPPVHVEEHDQEADDAQALLQQVAGHLGHGVLDLLHVGRDVAHQRARGVSPQERERLVEDVLVEGVSEVGDRALADVGHQRGREVGARALHEVEEQDEGRDLRRLDVLDQDLVEDRLHVDTSKAPAAA